MDVTQPFAAEVDRLRAAGAVGASGRVRDIFDWLAARGADAPSATQEQIAREVFGQTETDADDATVRVYVHRLRRKIDEFYAHDTAAAAGGARLEIPPGSYALRLRGAPDGDTARTTGKQQSRAPMAAVVAAIVVVAVGVAAWLALARPAVPNPIWEPIAQSDRPVLLVLGDYYLFGEVDPVRPEQSRLIRDFRVDSAADLAALQEAEPGRYGAGEDVGLNYLPFSSAYGLLHVLPLLAESGEDVTVVAASQLEPDQLNRYDVVYVGLVSGLHLLEEQTFAGSGFAPGESYDELIDRPSRRTFTSSEARSLASPAFYEDHALLTGFEASSGAQMVIIAGQRETALRGVAALVAGDALPPTLAGAARDGAFEALFRVTGQQGADLADTLVIARPRD